MLSVICVEYQYAECRYAECRYAECRGAIQLMDVGSAMRQDLSYLIQCISTTDDRT